MKYIALIYTAPGSEPQYGSPEFGPYMAEYKAASEAYVKAGIMRGGEALQPTATATTLRVRGGKAQTMDGPFAETKEQLGGFYIFECADLDEAIKYASMIPTVRNGCVEIRPILDVG
jgi:hypothetical protein